MEIESLSAGYGDIFGMGHRTQEASHFYLSLKLSVDAQTTTVERDEGGQFHDRALSSERYRLTTKLEKQKQRVKKW